MTARRMILSSCIRVGGSDQREGPGEWDSDLNLGAIRPASDPVIRPPLTPQPRDLFVKVGRPHELKGNQAIFDHLPLEKSGEISVRW